MALDIQQQMLIEQRIGNEAKSPVAAYLLCLFLGWFGAHRIYLGRTGSGVAMLIMSLTGIVLSVLILPLALLVVTGIWAFVDLFLIGGILREEKEALRMRLSTGMEGGAIAA
ncbi:TM2 domain-containing protein [Paracoccus sp. 1_MG-2023]|uniref:TM2 domain-containing protein n=1 Tax=unclassified Paracoccus (in: a-proteobacteria) TaxID=2688777 RepID=UPI001C0A3788|nr:MULTISPECIES: TM2 domain-containing protein [unclassified Paracoccus (in: a-proteobacteria)]MBU2958069.1 TM2 domain-containing protein [Paracoccus sp. C2R09]MDO6669345.1 TM2 domain-containing protein [Paracoccus sp. 1_MG-2023]